METEATVITLLKMIAVQLTWVRRYNGGESRNNRGSSQTLARLNQSQAPKDAACVMRELHTYFV